MPSPYELFKTDEKVEKDEGVVLDYGDFKIRIARAGGKNSKFGRMLNARLKPFRRQMDTDTMDEAVANKIMVETYADAVILGWENVKNEAGEVMEYNRANVVKLFTDLPDLFRDVQAQAGMISIFRAAAQEKDAKNSPAA